MKKFIVVIIVLIIATFGILKYENNINEKRIESTNKESIIKISEKTSKCNSLGYKEYNNWKCVSFGKLGELVKSVDVNF